MKRFYDLHLHSCLSPCGDEDMTPANMVHMADLKGLQAIALTDHNSCKNCPAFLEAAKEAGILALPGMELCTSEEIHTVCLFETLEGAMEFSRLVSQHIPAVKNRPDIYGRQLVMDAREAVLEEEEILLVTASDLSIYQVPRLVEPLGGLNFFAHADKPAYSILSALGEFPPDLPFATVELSRQAEEEEFTAAHPVLRGKRILRNSDAHYLWDINEPKAHLYLEEPTPKGLMDVLRNPTEN